MHQPDNTSTFLKLPRLSYKGSVKVCLHPTHERLYSSMSQPLAENTAFCHALNVILPCTGVSKRLRNFEFIFLPRDHCTQDLGDIKFCKNAFTIQTRPRPRWVPDN